MSHNTNLFRRGLPRRLYAMTLAVCMVFTMSPPMTAAEASDRDSGEPVIISGFAELPQSVREQNVPLGLSVDEITLPDTLKATVYSALEDIQPPADSLEPEESPVQPTEPIDDGSVEAPPADSSGADTDTTAPPAENDTVDEGASSDETPPAENSGADTDTTAPPAENGTVDEETSSTPPAEDGDDNSSAEENETPSAGENVEAAPGGEDSGEPAADESEAVQEVPVSATEVAAFSSRIKAVQYLAAPVKNKQEIVTLSEIKTPLAASPSDAEQEESKDSGTSETSPIENSDGENSADAPPADNGTVDEEVSSDIDLTVEPEETKKTVTGVTWESTPDFDGDTAGTYTFTPVLPDGYAVEDGVSLPAIIVTVGHILEYGDCMDFTCPTHYTPEVLAEMNEDETPVPLTLEDLINDYGIEAPAPRRSRAAASPQTLMVTDDNENNAHTGTADGDMDAYMSRHDKNHPIEIAFTIPADKMPTQNAYLAVKAYDVDEDYPRVTPEHDYVYINDDVFLPRDTFEPDGSQNCYNPATIGYLSGTSSTWNTTVLEIPLEKLRPGKNVISITVSPGWCVEVDWMQLILDGGEKDVNIESFSLKLGDPVNTSDAVQVPATVTIKQKGSTEYATEYTLIQTATGNALDAKFGKAQTQETVALSMPKNSQTGTYKITGILKDPVTEAIKASDEVEFTFTQNVGAVLAPKVTHTLTPAGLTKQNVTIAVSVKNPQGCTDISIQDNGQRTVTTNGNYTFTVNYKTSSGAAETMTYTVSVTNIDKTLPVIAYTAFSVLEGTSDAEVAALFKAALTATDDRQLAGAPTYTLPANIAATPGPKNITVTAKDVAGNTATQNCAITVTPLPLELVQNTPVRVGTTDSFTLSAVLKSTSSGITETGFVWGIMQSPTTAVNNGTDKTTPAVTTKGGTITITAADLADGVNYYARPYAISGGVTFYGDQKQFSYGGKQYGTFAVTNNGDNTFTITRTGGSEDAQTVYYRTVNGSAVGGTHFTHAASTVAFAAGETSKTVTVAELGVNNPASGKPATAFSNANRTYQLEIYRVEGGGSITGGVSRATRTLSKTALYSVDRNHYNYQVGVTATSIGDNRTGNHEREVREDHYGIPKANGDFTYTYKGTRSIPNLTLTPLNSGLYPNKEMAYIRDTASAMRVQLQDLNCIDDTTYMVYKWVLFNTTSANPQMIADKKDNFDNQKNTLPATTKYILIYGLEKSGGNTDDVTIVTLPKPQGTQLYESTRTPGKWHIVREEWFRGDQPSREYVQYGFDETCYISLGSYGGSVGNQYMSFTSGKLATAPDDTVEPKCLGMAPMAGGTYKPGDSVTVSLVFDEIVDSANSNLSSVTIGTSYGDMSYAGGGDTNVLYFTGTVPDQGNINTIEIYGINNSANIKDMCDQTGTDSGGSGGSGNITVDNLKPTVSITNGGITNGTAKGTINAGNASSVKYTWSNSSTPPVSGWLACTDGYTAQTRQTTGVWYLHAIAERSSNGTSSYTNTAFDFTNPASPLPTLAVSADNTNWAHRRNINITRTPANATVTYAGPQSGTAAGNIATVSENGLYTFTLTSGDETITEMVSVSRLDAIAPTLTLREPGGAGAVYNTLTFAADAADNLSGIAKVEYAITGTSAVPGSWATLSGSGGSYNGSYTETAATTKTTKYIHVRATDAAGNVTTKTSAAYTVVKENAAAAPVIALTGAPASWTKGPVNLTWNVTNQGASGITVYLNGSTSTATSGTLAATGNGLYSVSVTDQNGVSANASLLVDKIDAEAPILTKLSSPTGWATSKAVTLTGVTDNRTPLPDASGTTTGYGGSGLKTREWKLGSGSYTAFTGNSFAVSTIGTYTVRLTDNAGNTNEYDTLVSQVDTTAPVVTVGTPAADWTSAAQSIAVTYIDSQSGIDTAQYAITTTNGGAAPTTLTNLPASGGTVSVATNGTSYIYYKVTDKAGNVTDGYSGAIKVDTTTPTISITGNPTAWQNTDVTLTLNVSAAGFSAQTVTVSKDSGTAQTVTGNTYTATANGSYLFTVTTGAGKTATQTVVVDKIDKANPANATVTLNPSTADGENGWHKSLSIGVAQSVADGGSPITTYYKLWQQGQAEPADGTALASGAASIPAPADGEWKLLTYTTDSAGNTSGDSAITSFKLDKAAPVIGTLTYSEGHANLWDWIIGKTSLIVTVPVTESGSGADKISYTMTPSSGSAVSKTANISGGNAEIAFDEAFKGTVVISCTDKAGNQSATVSVGKNGVIVENFAPTITIVERDGKTPNADGWYNTIIRLTATVKDDGVSGGLAWVEKKIDNGTVTKTTSGPGADGKSYNFAANLTTTFPDYFMEGFLLDGEHTAYFRAADNAGNTSEWQSFTYKKDTGKPKINTPSLSESGYTDKDITVSVPITDGYDGSGIKSVTVVGATGGTMAVTEQDNTYQFTTTINDTFTITATDLAGNVQTMTYTVNTIDKTTPKAPTLTIEGGTEGENGWYTSEVQFTVTKGDNPDVPSLTKEVAYSTDGGTTWSNWQSDMAFIIRTDGDYTGKIVAKTRSGAGAESPASAASSIKIDQQTPVLTISGGETGAAQFDFAIALESPFGPSGGVITVSKDSEAAQTVTDGKYTVTEAGNYYITATSGAGLTDKPNRLVYAVSFDSKGGSAVTRQLVTDGGKATVPTPPTKKGFDFTAWHKPYDSSPYVFDTEVTDDLSLEAVWELGAPTVSLAADNANATYNGGTAATLTATTTHGLAGATFAYEWYKDGVKIDGETSSALELETVADSGEYTVKVTASADGLTSAQAESNAVTVAITKAPVTFDVTNNTPDYDGTAKAATVTQADGETPDVSGKFTVSYEKDGSPVTDPTSMGIYSVLVELTDANFKHKNKADSVVKIQVGTLTINGIEYPGADTMTWPTAADLTYGQALSDSILTGGDQAAKGTYTWTTPDTVPTVQNDGYWVVFTPADGNYAPVEKIINITVAKATPSLALPTAAGITYGDTLADSSLTGGSASTTYNGTANTDVPGKYKWTTPTTMPTVSDSGSTEYGLTFTPDDTDNYNVVTTGKVKLTVEQREAALRWSGHTGLTYTGRPTSVTATVTNLADTDSCAVTVTGGTETSAGDYTAKATALANGNYKLPAAVEQAYTIAKAPVTFAVTANEHDYDAAAKTATVAQTAGEAPAASGKFTVSYAKDGNPVAAPTNAGVYDVVVTLTDANFKHKGKEDTVREIKVGTLTIVGVKYPQADTMSWPTAANLTYGQTLSDSALTGGDQTAKGSYAWKSDTIIPTVQNSGYTVVFTPADTNYAPVEHTVSITVAKATATLTLPTAAGITYGDTLAKSALSGGSAEASYNGANKAVPGEFKWTVSTTKPAVSDSNSTEYGLTFTPTDTVNYNVVSTGKVKLAVAQKSVGLTWAGHTALVYNGSAVNVTATATGLVGSDSCTVTVTDGSKTDFGSYTAKVTAVSNPNYKLPDNTEQAYTIAKKPVKVLWSNLFPTYDGTQKYPTLALEGVVNGEDCSVLSTGSAAAGNAGRYKVAAALQGDRSANYTMQNPGEILAIQPAPVSISLSDYSYKYDGTAKSATVTATPDVPLTVTYELAGNAVATPTEEGIYDILVELDGKNYRFADGTDGKARRMGALTIYKEKPPELYTITFDPGAEDAAGNAPTLPAAVKDTVHFLPSNPFLRAGHAFVGWKNGDTLYQPGERFVQPANNSTVFTAQWEAATYDIGGVVDQDGKPVANVRVVLMRGAEQVAETVTNQIGEYHFNNVLPGLYNLVASKPSSDGVGDIIMTIMAEVKAADVEQANITLPSGKTNSIVEVAPGTPKIIVGNLDQTFKNTGGSDYTPEDKEVVNKGGTVEIKFIAEEMQKSEITGDAEEISKEAGNAKIGLYLALDVEKTVTQPANPDTPDVEPPSDTTPVPETSVLLESVIPLPNDLQGKQSYTVYRVHDGTVDSLTTDMNSGERIEVSEDKTTLTLYAQKFSTYAIAYTEKSSGGGDDGDGGSGGGNGGGSGDNRPIIPDKPEQPQPPVNPTDLVKPGEGTPAPGTTPPSTVQPGTAQPGTDQPDPTRPDDKQETDGTDKTEPDSTTEQKPDGGENETQKDEIRDALDDAIKNLPDTLTDEQRQAAIDELTEIADAAIAALDGTSDPDESDRIAQQARDDMEKLVAEALALAGDTAKPFVLASALIALAAVILAVLNLLGKKRRAVPTAICAALAAATFQLTTGWSGFVLADWWTLLVAAFTAMAVICMGAAKKDNTHADEDAAK